MSNADRLEYIRNYYANQKIVLELPALVSETTQGRVVRRFNGTRIDYKFVDGRTEIDRKDLHKFLEMYPNIIIHNEKETK